MRAINKANKLIQSAPHSSEAIALRELVLALETGAAFQISKIYELDYKSFELALAVMADWRLDRHYASKFRLIDAALQSSATGPDAAP